MKVLIEEAEIQQIVKKLADQINQDYQGKSLILIGVLKGSIVFMSDLMRQLEMPLEIDFVQLASYQGDQSTGKIKLVKDLTTDIAGQDVLVIEDIIDTGLTLNWLKENLAARQPKSLKVVTFIGKPSRRKVEIKADYIGKEIPDKFVVGYGLDYNEKYRYLPYVGVLEQDNN